VRLNAKEHSILRSIIASIQSESAESTDARHAYKTVSLAGLRRAAQTGLVELALTSTDALLQIAATCLVPLEKHAVFVLFYS
jgi:hypothetical protein